MTTTVAPTRHKVPQVARDLRELFRDSKWQTALDSWFSAGRDYASVVVVADPVRITAIWSTAWGSDDFTFAAGAVVVRGPNHPPNDFARLNPWHMDQSPADVALPLDAVRAVAGMDLADVESWARTLTGGKQ